MTITSLNIPFNYFPSQNQNSINTSSSPTTIKKSNDSKLYLGPGWTSVPGMTNLIYDPYVFVKSVKATVQAGKIDDLEGIIVNGVKATTTPVSFLNSVLLSLDSLFLLAWKHSLISSSLFIPVTGFIVCAFEGFLETYGLIKTKQFYSQQYPSELESLKKTLSLSDAFQQRQKFSKHLSKFLLSPELPIEVKNEIETFLRKKDSSQEEFHRLASTLFDQVEKNVLIAKLKRLQATYLQISPEEMNKIETRVKDKFSDLSLAKQQEKKEEIIDKELSRKSNDLIRRVHPWLKNEIQESIPEILENLRSSNPLKSREAQDKGAEIFKNIKTQSMKRFLIHSVGLVAVIIVVAGLILGFVACPHFLSLLFLTIGGVLAFARYFLNVGLMDSRDWEFKVDNCIPSFVKSIYEKITSRAEEKKAPESFHLPLDFNPFRKNNAYPPHFDFTVALPAIKAQCS